MFLKRLDLVGFKSFAERLSIDFVKGVTAVVGPNGSGKSNISDAIRWVLGEQSAKNLRGAKMEDVIFSGSDSRKPLNMAEITLVLDNEDQHLAIDYSEVAVTRRVYRSGDSEYLINKQPCRLKDIVDLFMDSGLGKEAFSIIGQGRVEEILSSKSEERRMIFEEAAGVLKYKNRKVKSEKKLNDTQENLNRVKDIIYELEGQVEPLKEQSSIAKEYLEKKAELKDFEVGVLVKEIEEMHTKWDVEKKQLEDLQDKEASSQATVKQYEAKIERLRTDMQTLDNSINELQDLLLKTSEELEKQEGQKEVWKERKKNFAQHREQFIEEMSELKSQKESISKEVVKYEHEVNTNKDKVKRTKELLVQQEKEMTLLEQNTVERLEQLKADYIEWLNEKASQKNEIRYLEEQLSKQENKQERMDKDNQELLTKREQIRVKLQEAQQEWKTEKSVIEEKINAFQLKKQQYGETEREYEKKENFLYEAFRHVQQLKSRKEVLEEMQNDYSGFFLGVKEILKERDRQFKGIKGAVAELIDVSKEFQTAIDIALGPAQQHVVVEDEATGRSAIQFLKQRKLGRATFLPMTVIKPRHIQGQDVIEAQQQQGFVGVAKELVQYETEYENIVSHLLGNIIVAKDIKSANNIARAVRFRFRIVTLEGDVINPGGAMTGGSIKQKQSQILGRQQELERVSSKLEQLDNEAMKLQKDVSHLKQKLSSIQLEMKELQEQGEELREKEQEKKSRFKELELSEETINERLKLYDLEKNDFEEDVKEKQERISQLRSAIIQCDEKISTLNKEIDYLSTEQEKAKASKETLSTTITNTKINLAKEEEQLNYALEMYTRIQKSLENIVQSLSLKENEFHALERDLSTQSESADSLEEVIEKRRIEKDRTIELISRRRSDRLSLQQEHDDAERELKEHKRQLRFVSSTLHETEVRVNRLDVDLDNRLSKLQGEYEISYEAAKGEYPLTVDLDDARKKVKLIKLAIEELGNVNVGAIEEYDRVKERYEFLLEQKEDLEDAKATLHQVITEMDEEMTKRFKECFDQIQSHFHVVFKELFGGGQADLRLTDPEDLLNTGVEIVAQPPGKKLQHLALLSGGERALTAIALLFAILKVRPVPFCVLDEVEAALDDANVVRFAQYLKDFSHETQFIVVTHRKGTMEEADVLYGVTMQESGVSTMMSVKLEESKALVGVK
ncbi:chromosome segregation protein SMC [Evansella cellulosilytica]|uniref:Chromosome partition protein Smc n=1 Tax=Evansella cellulosilytica (strain ATCC 21833 / DSM 2522 / FERM P-1141 / JCM 9156 / N-4) TaxID=649639 RepID=E6TSZ6_EVAC2|nr:chromosome segregation protein SMC [Evansella cellulosilytica]ADU30788.1 chromosome segregation protein SMC [Evansella cellulosilytica DSM 2522]